MEDIMNRTLIIDSNTTFRNTLRDFLQSRFPAMILEVAKNGEEAIQKATYFRPDIIFMDIKLPKEAAVIDEKMKNLFPKVTVVLFINYGLNEFREALEVCGANHILHKGLATAKEIEGLVHSILNFTHCFPINKSCPSPQAQRQLLTIS